MSKTRSWFSRMGIFMTDPWGIGLRFKVAGDEVSFCPRSTLRIPGRTLLGSHPDRADNWPCCRSQSHISPLIDQISLAGAREPITACTQGLGCTGSGLGDPDCSSRSYSIARRWQDSSEKFATQWAQLVWARVGTPYSDPRPASRQTVWIRTALAGSALWRFPSPMFRRTSISSCDHANNRHVCASDASPDPNSQLAQPRPAAHDKARLQLRHGAVAPPGLRGVVILRTLDWIPRAS